MSLSQWVDLARFDGDRGWRSVHRLTVLVALPGWGRTTWLRQLAGRVRGEGRTVTWVGTQRDFDAFLADDEPTDLIGRRRRPARP